jgi:3-hydroxyacyl-CoA dehydrogenase
MDAGITKSAALAGISVAMIDVREDALEAACTNADSKAKP